MEVQKWQQHLSLLREQYVNLYNSNIELQKEYAIATAEKQESGFVSRLLATIASLYCQHRYRYLTYNLKLCVFMKNYITFVIKKCYLKDISFSDINIKLIDQEIPAHKFVLSARTDFFSDTALVEKSVLGNILSVYFFHIYDY